jgi:hypothetical protein
MRPLFSKRYAGQQLLLIQAEEAGVIAQKAARVHRSGQDVELVGLHGLEKTSGDPGLSLGIAEAEAFGVAGGGKAGAN